MGLFSALANKLAKRKERKAQDDERLHVLRLEANEIEKQEFEKKSRALLKSQAIMRARRDAQSKVGIAKLRAQRRLEFLGKPTSLSERLRKFQDFRLRNLERTARNKARTAELIQQAKTQKITRLKDAQARREFGRQRVELQKQEVDQIRRRPFEPRGFGR